MTERERFKVQLLMRNDAPRGPEDPETWMDLIDHIDILHKRQDEFEDMLIDMRNMLRSIHAKVHG